MNKPSPIQKRVKQLKDDFQSVEYHSYKLLTNFDLTQEQKNRIDRMEGIRHGFYYDRYTVSLSIGKLFNPQVIIKRIIRLLLKKV
jgi:hypothetical protein